MSEPPALVPMGQHDLHRDPAGRDQRLQEAEIAHGILLGHKGDPGQQGPARIIHRPDQRAAGAPRLEPGMGATIPEDEQARLGAAVGGGAAG